jgi:hypothetical protein
MFLDPLNIKRTEWKTENLVRVFEKVLPLFPQLLEEDIEEIKNRLQTNDVSYLEIAHYESAAGEEDDKDPSSILVIDNNSLYYDIVDTNRATALIKKFEDLSEDSIRFIKTRKITKKELQKRLESFLSMQADTLQNDDFEDDLDEDDEYIDDEDFDFVEKDESGHLERTAVHVIAKQPVLDWLNESQKKEPRRLVPVGDIDWTLEIVNKEPSVFLIPVALELVPKKEAARYWRLMKEKIFMKFVEGYYADESYWPSYSGEKQFDQWFEIKQLGMVIDLVDEDLNYINPLD